MWEIIADTLLDTLKALPFLFLVYLLLEYIGSIQKKKSVDFASLNRLGPLLGAVAGCIPQCGFSAAAAALYNERAIKGGTLIAVFLATSDEALPVMLTYLDSAKYILPMLAIKFAAGVFFGYILNYTLFYSQKLYEKPEVEVEFHSCEVDEHHHKKSHFLTHAIYHTLKISAFILVTMLVINMIIHYAGIELIEKILLKGSVFAPFLTAAAGLIPGCSISVLITELFINGNISFGSCIAGLCTGAGFGYVILFRSKKIKNTLLIIAATYVCSVAIGMIINLVAI